MNGRDFIYWLHGGFELNKNLERAVVICTINLPIILEHITLVKKNDRDSFFENVCYIEGVLSCWAANMDVAVSAAHMVMINNHIEKYLNSIFTKVTSGGVTFLPAGMREKIEEDVKQIQKESESSMSPFLEPTLGRESWDSHSPPAPNSRTYCFDSKLNLTC